MKTIHINYNYFTGIVKKSEDDYRIAFKAIFVDSDRLKSEFNKDTPEEVDVVLYLNLDGIEDLKDVIETIEDDLISDTEQPHRAP